MFTPRFVIVGVRELELHLLGFVAAGLQSDQRAVIDAAVKTGDFRQARARSQLGFQPRRPSPIASEREGRAHGLTAPGVDALEEPLRLGEMSRADGNTLQVEDHRVEALIFGASRQFDQRAVLQLRTSERLSRLIAAGAQQQSEQDD